MFTFLLPIVCACEIMKQFCGRGKKLSFFLFVLSPIMLREKGSYIRTRVVKVFVTYYDFNFTFFFPPFFFFLMPTPHRAGAPTIMLNWLFFSFAHWLSQ